jgi:hypothetical protein
MRRAGARNAARHTCSEAPLYGELKIERIEDTLEMLHRRIAERFPGSGLTGVATELRNIASATEGVVEKLRKPIWPLRIGAAVGISAIIAIFGAAAIIAVQIQLKVQSFSELLQTGESGTNDIILLCVAIYFFVTLEGRVKQRAALTALHRLRTIVHIVDMHQLSKDPEHLLAPAMRTESSPKRTMTRFELARYLDYCSELLSLSSKLAALHVQYLNDPVVLDAVNDIETLAASLSNKIWQKIMILDLAVPGSET